MEFDHEKKGALMGDNVLKLLEQVRMRKCTFDVAAVKAKLDPLKVNKVTFSTFVEVLSSIPAEGSNLSVVQKLGNPILISSCLIILQLINQIKPLIVKVQRQIGKWE